MSIRCMGLGQCGMTLASKFDKTPILISTAHQDTVNFKHKNVYSFSEEGASKRFRTGAKIWANSYNKLEEICEPIRDEQVIVFSSLGGGSGGSCLNPLSRILLRNDNKVLLITILPYKKEINPPLANAVQALNSLMPIIQKVSVIIFDNEKLRKEIGNDWNEINKYILKRVDYIINMIRRYSIDKYSPITLDQSELDSVVFGGGFIDLSNSFLEDGSPKFEYGKLDKETKNCLVAMYVDHELEDTDKYHNILTSVVDKLSSRVPNARMIPGILRGKIINTYSKEGLKDRAYITIASGLNINKYLIKIEKLRDLAIKKASVFAEERESGKFINRADNKMLDI